MVMLIRMGGEFKLSLIPNIRCGMVWFSTECLTLPMLFSNQLNSLKFTQIKSTNMGDMRGQFKDWEEVQATVVDYIKPIFEDEGGLVYKAMEWEFTRTRPVCSLFSQLRGIDRWYIY